MDSQVQPGDGMTTTKTGDLAAHDRCAEIIAAQPTLGLARYAGDLAAHLYLPQQEVDYPDWTKYVATDPAEIRRLIHAQASNRQGFNAMGHPIPVERLTAALAAVREMLNYPSTDEAMSLIGRVARELELDQPYEAMRIAREALDLTGTYRLVATLLADGVASAIKGAQE